MLSSINFVIRALGIPGPHASFHIGMHSTAHHRAGAQQPCLIAPSQHQQPSLFLPCPQTIISGGDNSWEWFNTQEMWTFLQRDVARAN